MPTYTPIIQEIAYPESPRAAFARLLCRPGSILLESGLPDPRLGQWSFLACDPFLTFHSKGSRIEISGVRSLRERHFAGLIPRPPLHCVQGRPRDDRGGAGGKPRRSEGPSHFSPPTQEDPFAVLAQLLGDIRVARPAEAPPLLCGAMGYFGYDLGRFVERLPEHTVDDVPVADCHLGFYGAVLALNHQQTRAWICAIGAPEQDEKAAARLAEARTEELLAHLQASTPPLVTPASSPTLPLTSTFTRRDYLAAVQRAKDYIAAGDIYQVNLSQRLSAPLATTPFSLYQRLMRENPAPFAAYFETPDAAIVSCSPERFLQVRGREVETRPIKGTRPRGATPEEDARLAAELLASEKDRAENVMIVDLERNDLGKVCEYGSVHVPELFAVESYATVHHLVSTVRGRLRPGTTALDCLREAFPGGSITGAPKVRSMEIIEELEPTRRGVYTGAIGYLCFSGDMDVNIVIRTVIVKDGVAHFQVGGGIVADSDPEAEYQETIDKGQALARALAAEAGAEGIRWPE